LLVALTATTVDGQEKKLKELQWSHAFDLACRKKDEANITDKTTRWGVEAFRDNNTGGGIGLYISQTGSIAIAPNFANLNRRSSRARAHPGSPATICPPAKPACSSSKRHRRP